MGDTEFFYFISFFNFCFVLNQYYSSWIFKKKNCLNIFFWPEWKKNPKKYHKKNFFMFQIGCSCLSNKILSLMKLKKFFVEMESEKIWDSEFLIKSFPKDNYSESDVKLMNRNTCGSKDYQIWIFDDWNHFYFLFEFKYKNFWFIQKYKMLLF